MMEKIKIENGRRNFSRIANVIFLAVLLISVSIVPATSISQSEDVYDEISFHVYDDSLENNIISPSEYGWYGSEELTVEWDYVSDVPIEEHEVFVERVFQEGWESRGTTDKNYMEDVKVRTSTGLEIKVETRDEAGNSATDIIEAQIDLRDPKVDIESPEPFKWYDSSEIKVEWNPRKFLGPSDIEECEVFLNGQSLGKTSGKTSEREMNIDIDDGKDHEIRVDTYDEAGNSDTDEIVIHVDTEPPDIEIVSPVEREWYPGGKLNVEFDIYDHGLSEIKICEVFLEGEYKGNTTRDNIEIVPDKEGEDLELEVEATDKAGNTGNETIEINIDDSPPQIDIENPKEEEKLDRKDVNVSWDANGILSEISHYKVRLGYGAWLDVEENRSSYIFENLDDGNHSVTVKAVDEVGNEAEKSVNFTVDTVPPEIEIKTPEEGWYGSKDLMVEWDTDHQGPTTIEHEVFVDGRSHGNTTNTEMLIEDIPEGEDRQIKVEARDEAGNLDDDIVVVGIDITSPTVNLIYPEDGETITGDPGVIAEWEGEDNISGIHKYQLRLNHEDWIDIGKNTTYNLDEFTQRENKLEVEVFDRAGNSETDLIEFSLGPPTWKNPPLLSPENDTYDTEDKYDFEWEEAESPAHIESYRLQISDHRGFHNLLYEFEVESSTTYKTHTFDEEATYYWRVKAVDKVGNSNITEVNQLTFDETAPEGDIDIIADEIIDGKKMVEDADITINMSFYDHLTSERSAEMEISKNGNFTEDWQPFKSEMNYSLQEEGDYTFFVRFRDRSGLISETYNDTVTYGSFENDLKVEKIGNGTVIIEPEKEGYEFGEDVVIKAEPHTGWTFKRWRGEIDELEDETKKEIAVEMTEDKYLEAEFVRDEFKLEILSDGDGMVNPDVGEHFYEYEEKVELEATPHDSWGFERWSGYLEDADKKLSFEMPAEDITITANFESETYTLNTTLIGEGTVDIEPQKDHYERGEEVQLISKPDDGWVFDKWSGDIYGLENDTQNEIRVNMTDDMNLTAELTRDKFDLKIEVVGNGTTNPSEGVHPYEYEEEILIDPSPNKYWHLANWSLDGEEKEGEITVAMTQDKNVTIHFEENLIEDVHDLQEMKENLDAYYKLANNIDASETEEWNDGRGFDPIGEEGDSFNGKLLGQDHVIIDLHIDRPYEDYVGLFGDLSDDAVVQNIGLRGAGITGNEFVGGVAGSSSGTITSSYTNSVIIGENNVGGISGRNLGNINITFSAAEVNGVNNTGGLVGWNFGGAIEDSYFLGDVLGVRGAAGITGINNAEGNITNIVMAGEVDGEEFIGSIVGQNHEGTAQNMYWIEEICDKGGEGIGISVEQITGLDALESLKGFDFATIWDVVDADHADADEDRLPVLSDLPIESQVIHQDIPDEEYQIDESLLSSYWPIIGMLSVIGVICIILIIRKKDVFDGKKEIEDDVNQNDRNQPSYQRVDRIENKTSGASLSESTHNSDHKGSNTFGSSSQETLEELKKVIHENLNRNKNSGASRQELYDKIIPEGDISSDLEEDIDNALQILEKEEKLARIPENDGDDFFISRGSSHHPQNRSPPVEKENSKSIPVDRYPIKNMNYGGKSADEMIIHYLKENGKKTKREIYTHLVKEKRFTQPYKEFEKTVNTLIEYEDLVREPREHGDDLLKIA